MKRRRRQPQHEPQGYLVDLADALAPSSIEICRDAVRLDDFFARVLAVSGYPRSVVPGFLERMTDLNEPLDLSLHIQPQENGAVVRKLSRRLVQLHSSRLLDERYGRVGNAERSIAYADVERTRDRVQRGDERVFAVALYLRVDARTPTDLDAQTARIRAALDNAQLDARPATFEHDLGVRSCLPECRDYLGRALSLDTSSLAMAFPFSSAGVSMERGILYGTVPNGSLVILDPFAPHMENANHLVFAKSGAGKSYLCKVTALRHLLLGTDVYIVDPEDEYAPLCVLAGGQFIGLAPGSGYHINPFDLPSDAACVDGKASDPLAEKVAALHALLDLMLAERGPFGRVTLSQREKSLLDHALYETYRRVGITSDQRTHTNDAPLLRDLHRVLVDGTCGVDDTGLGERLRRYVEGSLAGLFAAPTNVMLNNRLVVFGVRDLDSELRPLGLFLITDFVETRMRQAQRPRLLYIDEAWTLMQFPEGARFLASLARRGRKRYLGLVCITQNAEDFLSSEHGRVVLAQSSIQILLKQDAATIDAVANAFHLSAHERQYVLGSRKGEGLLFARGGHTPIRFEASAVEHEIATTDPREIAARAAKPPSMAAAQQTPTKRSRGSRGSGKSRQRPAGPEGEDEHG